MTRTAGHRTGHRRREAPPGTDRPPGYGAPGYPPGFGSSRPQIDIGAALSYGWRKFSENVGGWLSLAGVIVVAALVFGA